MKCEYNTRIMTFMEEMTKNEIAPQIKHDPDLYIDIGPWPKAGYYDKTVTLVKITMVKSTSIDYCVGQGFTGGDLYNFSPLDKVISHINDVWIEDQRKGLAIIKKRRKDIDNLQAAMEEMAADHYNLENIPSVLKATILNRLKLDDDLSGKLVHFYVIGAQKVKDKVRTIEQKKRYWNIADGLEETEANNFKFLTVAVREDTNKFKLILVEPYKSYNYISYRVEDTKWYVAKNIMRHLNNFANTNTTVAAIISDPGNDS